MKNILYTICILLTLSIFSGCSDTTNDDSAPDVEITTDDVEETLKSSPYLQTSVDKNNIQLSWDKNSEASSYTIEWGDSSDSLTNRETFTMDKTSFTHTRLQENKIYYYRLVVHFKNDKESISSIVMALKTGSKETVMHSDVAL